MGKVIDFPSVQRLGDPALVAALAASHAAFPVWWFTGFAPKFYSRARLESYAKAGITGVIVGLNHEDDDRNGITPEDLEDPFVPIGGRKAASRIKTLLDNAYALGLRVMLMPWVRLGRRYNNELRSWVEPWTNHPAFYAICHDGERFAHRLFPSSMTLEQAIDDIWASYWSEQGFDQYYTDYTLAPSAVAGYLRYCTGGIPQAYPRASWLGRGRIYTPGVIQDRAELHWASLLGPKQRLISAGGAFDLAGHAGGVARAIQTQWDAMREGRESGAAWWGVNCASSQALGKIHELATELRMRDLYGPDGGAGALVA